VLHTATPSHTLCSTHPIKGPRASNHGGRCHPACASQVVHAHDAVKADDADEGARLQLSLRVGGGHSWWAGGCDRVHQQGLVGVSKGISCCSQPLLKSAHKLATSRCLLHPTPQAQAVQHSTPAAPAPRLHACQPAGAPPSLHPQPEPHAFAREAEAGGLLGSCTLPPPHSALGRPGVSGQFEASGGAGGGVGEQWGSMQLRCEQAASRVGGGVHGVSAAGI